MTSETVSDELRSHCRIVRRELREGKIIPFLGAGANLCGRPEGVDWLKDSYLPDGVELAKYLNDLYFDPTGSSPELIRVSQYIDSLVGGDALYRALRRAFNKQYQPNALHRLLADIPAAVRRWREEGEEDASFQLIVTTNYDDALEQAFTAASEEYDLVTYVAQGENFGKFIHRPPGGEPRLIYDPSTDRGLSLKERTAILKIHGAIDRQDSDRDSYVITEDNYINYLARSNIANFIPAALMGPMKESHFLFLGYSLADWNLRVILQRIWGATNFQQPFTSWAIQRNPSQLEKTMWDNRHIKILDVDIAEYVSAVRRLALTRDGEVPPA
ncbi:MAG: SIR2 family protein [Solirubrobacterales bacterium]|nr:SIR2 family protein [Solirubrobacterales bacterium]